MSVYEGIMEGLGEALAHAEGRRALRTTPVFEPVRDYRPDEIKQLRTGLGMTQVVFAGFLGVSPKTVEAWEAGRNRATPSCPTCSNRTERTNPPLPFPGAAGLVLQGGHSASSRRRAAISRSISSTRLKGVIR